MIVTKRNIINLIMLLGGIIIIYFLTKYILPYFVPFILALIISLLIEPIIKLLQRKFKLTRGAAVIITLISIFGGILLFLSIILVQLTSELVVLSSSLPDFFERFSDVAITKWKNLFLYYKHLPDNVHNVINQFALETKRNITGIASSLQGITKGVANSFLTTASKLPTLFAIIMVALLATFFISRDRSKIIKLWYDVLPYNLAEKSIRVMNDIINALMGYFKAQMILISITMVQSIIGLYIIGSEYAFIMGILIGFFDFLPVLGPSAVFLPWIGWEFIIGNNVLGVKLSVLWIIVMLVRQLLEAKVVSESIGLHPLITLMAMYIGLKAFGVLGLILGPIAIIAIQAIWKAGFINIKFK